MISSASCPFLFDFLIFLNYDDYDSQGWNEGLLLLKLLSPFHGRLHSDRIIQNPNLLVTVIFFQDIT